MKATTRAIMRSLKRSRAAAPSRAHRAALLRQCRAIRGGRASLRETHLYHYVPCPACGRHYDRSVVPPPRVPLDIRCACCCQ